MGTQLGEKRREGDEKNEFEEVLFYKHESTGICIDRWYTTGKMPAPQNSRPRPILTILV